MTPLSGSSYQDFKVYMKQPSMTENASQKQVNYIKFLLKDSNIWDYWNIREHLEPEHISKAEASDLINDLENGRDKFAIKMLLNKIGPRCPKCGDEVLGDESGICGICACGEPAMDESEFCKECI